jgi:membrane-bound metal-dependent hydrolase YbcI (DUF457 family)
MEPLLHYILPLTALILLGEKPKTSAILATLGVVSDIDALLLIHRSLSHSLVIIGLIYTPLFLYAWHRKPGLQRTFILAFLVSASHPILDLGGLTPILWPIIQNSLSLHMSLNGVMQEGFSFRPRINIKQVPTDFSRFTGFDYPLFTQDGLLTATILLLPIIYNQINKRSK